MSTMMRGNIDDIIFRCTIACAIDKYRSKKDRRPPQGKELLGTAVILVVFKHTEGVSHGFGGNLKSIGLRGVIGR